MKPALLVLCFLVWCGATPASAVTDIPDPGLSTVPNVLYDPSGALIYRVQVVGSGGPIDSALVQIVVSDEVDSLICWCPGQVHPVIEEYTAPDGYAEFRISAGGCIDPGGLINPPGIEVYANGVLLAEVGAVSPDIADEFGCIPTDPGCRQPTACWVGLHDGVIFSQLCGMGYSFCADLNSDGRVGIEDAVMMGTSLALGNVCGSPMAEYPYELPGENTEASIAWHLEPWNPDPCGFGLPCLTNGALVTEAPTLTPYYAYIVVCDGTNETGVLGAEFGINYDPYALYMGSTLTACTSVTLCGSGYTQPNMAAGMAFIDWYPASCLDPPDPQDPNNVMRVLGAAYVYAYAPNQLELIPNPTTGEALILECGGSTYDIAGIAPSRLGLAGFGMPGYNPSRTQDDKPICADDARILDEDTQVTFSPLGNDFHPCPEHLRIRWLMGTLGAVYLEPGETSVTYVPPPNYYGPDEFYYAASTLSGALDTARVAITVSPVNDPPVASPDSAATRADSTITIFVLANDTDVESDPLTVQSVDVTGTAGTVSITPADDAVIYTPNIAFAGVDTFQYTVSDGNGGTAVAPVYVDVSPAPPPGGDCDFADGGTWTFGHINLNTNCTWHAQYTTAASRSPDQSIWTYLGGGGGGQDFDHVYGRRTFPHGAWSPPDSVTTWFQTQVQTSGGVASYSYVRLDALDRVGNTLDSQVYCPAVDDDITDRETEPTWIYQEHRPAEYEPGAPFYSRGGDGSIRPPTGWWYKLTMDPATDLVVDWWQVDSIRVEVRSGGGYYSGDEHGMYWDDVCLFTAPAPDVQVFTPNGGESLEVHEVFEITWTAFDSTGVDSVSILYSTDAGASWTTIASGEANDGSHLWTVPNTPTDSALVAVIAYNPAGTPGHDESDGLFTIPVTPRILAITDVGNDQGRAVRVTWTRAHWDHAAVDTTVTSYSLWRRVAPGLEPAGGTAELLAYPPGQWDYVSSVPASGEWTYGTVAPTLCDSTLSAGMCWSVFFVRAHTGDPLLYVDTEPDSGYSLDNLAPCPPMNLRFEGWPLLVWDDPVDEDFQYFTVYGSHTDLLDPGAVVVGYTATPSVDVTGVPYEFFHLTATDFSGNESAAATLSNPVGLPEPGVEPGAFALLQNRPNPFRTSTMITFDLPHPERVTVQVYDVKGRLVRTLVPAQELGQGRYTFAWTGVDDAGRRVPPGVYVYRLEAGEYRVNRKATLIP